MLRHVAALGVLSVLCGCSATDSMTTASVARTPAPTTLPVEMNAYAAPPVATPAESLEGRWFVADDTERDCTVQFSMTPRNALIGDIYSAQPTGECVSSLSHIAAWSAQNGAIVLYDDTGRQLGVFTENEMARYGGNLMIETGQIFSATLRKLA